MTRHFIRPLLPLYHRLNRVFGLVPGTLTGDTYFLFDETRELSSEKLAAHIRFPENGHCTWRPGDPRCMLTDTYQDEEWHRSLLLYDSRERELIRIGRFYSLPETCNTGFRCDLHPRWTHSGDLVCIDSVHRDDERQMYLIDVSGVLAERSR